MFSFKAGLAVSTTGRDDGDKNANELLSAFLLRPTRFILGVSMASNLLADAIGAALEHETLQIREIECTLMSRVE